MGGEPNPDLYGTHALFKDYSDYKVNISQYNRMMGSYSYIAEDRPDSSQELPYPNGSLDCDKLIDGLFAQSGLDPAHLYSYEELEQLELIYRDDRQGVLICLEQLSLQYDSSSGRYHMVECTIYCALSR